MTTALDDQQMELSAEAAQRLRSSTAAVRLSIKWLGTRKTLTPGQRAEAAESFGAEGQFLSAGKKLLDVRHSAFRAVTAIRTKAVAHWKAETLPFPEPGLRLIRQNRIADFDARMRDWSAELDEAVENLDQHYTELKQAAAQRLGRLYNPADYPESLTGAFEISWDFPSVEPPDYLRRLHPELYEQECRRVANRFDEALQLAEQAFLEELHKLITHLTERLSGDEDGQPKVFRNSAIENLTEFFTRFGQLNVRSNAELDRLVDQAREIVTGVQPQSLRDNHVLRQSVAQELGEVQTVLDDLLVDRPRRNILRSPKSQQPTESE